MDALVQPVTGELLEATPETLGSTIDETWREIDRLWAAVLPLMERQRGDRKLAAPDRRNRTDTQNAAMRCPRCRLLYEDGGCFAAALASVRQWGGVLEHPAHSDAFKHFKLPKPQTPYAWTETFDGEAVCYVEQGRYGLPVKKATWLYAVGVELPELRWGYTPDRQGEEPNGAHGGIDNWRDRWAKVGRLGDTESWWSQERNSGMRSATPPEFRDVLLSIARTAAKVAA